MNSKFEDDKNELAAADDAARVVAGNDSANKNSWFARHHNHLYGGMSVLGVLLAVFALVITYMANPNVTGQDKRDIEEKWSYYSDLVHQPLEASPVPRIKVDEWCDQIDQPWPVPTPDGFQVLHHEVAVDFEHFKEITEAADVQKFSSAVIHNVKQHIRKLEDKGVFFVSASTTGKDLFVESKRPHSIHTCDAHSGRNESERSIVQFDVSDIAVGEEFVLKHKKTYWNAYQGDDQKWSGFEAVYPTDEVEYMILFPAERPFKSISHCTTTDGAGADEDGQVKKGKSRCYDETVVYQSTDERHFWWRASDPREGFFYRVEWEW